MSQAAVDQEPVDLVAGEYKRGFTLRAMLTGAILGGLLSVCNVYLGLKIGWGMNMSITAALLAYGLWRGVSALRSGKGTMGIGENTISQTGASAAASISSAGLVAPIPAWTMITGQELPYMALVVWVLAVSLIGVLVGIAVRRQLIEVDKLPFPGGLATGQTLKEMYASGAEAAQRVRLLLAGMVAGAISKIIASVFKLKPIGLPFSIPGKSAAATSYSGLNLTFAFDPGLLMIAIGAIIGPRAAFSMILGGVIAWGLLLPYALDMGWATVPMVTHPWTAEAVYLLWPLTEGISLAEPVAFVHQTTGAATAYAFPESFAEPRWVDGVGMVDEVGAFACFDHSSVYQGPWFSNGVRWLLWPGVSMMVAGSLTSFAFSWKSILAAFKGSASGEKKQVDERDVPKGAYLIALAFAAVLAIGVQWYLFDIKVWLATVAVALSFLMAIVAGRVSGETGVTPVGAMGKVTQLTFGVLDPSNVSSNLMAANVTGGSASQCGDLLHDMKTGAMVGAWPKHQAVSQAIGVVAGAFVGSACYIILIPDPANMLMTEEWAAPAVAVWKSVAELFAMGLTAMPPGTMPAMIIAGILGIMGAIAERLLPRHIVRWTPSMVSVGLAFTIQLWVGIAFAIGATIALLLERVVPSWTARFLIVVAAGIIAGETLAGVGDALWMMATK